MELRLFDYVIVFLTNCTAMSRLIYIFYEIHVITLKGTVNRVSTLFYQNLNVHIWKVLNFPFSNLSEEVVQKFVVLGIVNSSTDSGTRTE